MVIVDNVYQKVLALANKEQRGYITPQEFNLFAGLAQMEIFEQYFYDLEQFQRRMDNAVELIEEKIAIFKMGPVSISDSHALNTFINATTGEDHFYKIVQITKQDDNNGAIRVAERIEQEDYAMMQVSPLTQVTKTRPVFFIKDNGVYIYPETGANEIRYIRKPMSPNWTYFIGANESAIYNPNAADHRNFELHTSEENALVIKILQLAGVAIKDFNLVQLASQREISTIQQEKQ
jgi:hypothetical protein